MEELFNKTVPVKLKSNDRDEKQVAIGVTIILNTVSSPVQKKELLIRLTDNTDPFFLYTLALGEDDFQGLKVQQKLLVDFVAFPQKLIDLLELCLSEVGKESPRFLVQFCESSNQSAVSLLHVVETNLFRHLNHLSLKFVPASDTYLRKYLAECLLRLKEDNTSLSDCLISTKTDLSAQLAQCQETLQKRTQELERLKSDWSNHSAALTNEHRSNLNAEREKTSQVHSELQDRYEREKREAEQTRVEKLGAVEGRLKELDQNNKELTEHKFRSEAAIRELKAKLKSTEGECDSLRGEIQKLRKENSSLDARTHEQDKFLTQLRTRVAVLEQELQDKDRVMEKTSELLEASQEQKRAFETGLSQRERQITKLDTAFKSASREVLKGNEIIQKLQSEIRTIKSKLKMRNMVTTQQEMLLGEREKDIGKLKQELASFKQSLSQKEEELSKSESVLHETREKLEETQGQLKTNENVITWLNKQVTEQKLGGSHVSRIPVPSSTLSTIGGPSPNTLPPHYSSTTSYQGTLQNKPQFSSTPTIMYDSSKPLLHQHHHALPSQRPRNVLESLGSQENIGRQQVLFRGGLKRTGMASLPENAPVVKGVVTSGGTRTLPANDRESGAVSDKEPWLDPKYLPRDPPLDDEANNQGRTPNTCSTITPGVTKQQGILKTSAGGVHKNGFQVDQGFVAGRLKPATLASSYFPKS